MLTSCAADFGAIQFSGIDDTYRVSNYNEDGCTSASLVGQGYGPACWIQGHTSLRSAYVACPGDGPIQKVNGTTDTASISPA